MIRGDLESKNKRGTRILVDGGVIETRPVTRIIILMGEEHRWATDVQASGYVTAAWRIYCGKLEQHDGDCLAWATAALVWD